MPYQISIDKLIPSLAMTDFQPLQNFTMHSDTEFAQLKTLEVLGIGLHSPELTPDRVLVFCKGEITKDFNPIIELLRYSGHESTVLSEEEEIFIYDELEEINEIFLEEYSNLRGKALKKKFNELLNSGEFDDFLNRYNLNRDSIDLIISRSKGKTEYCINLNPPILDASLTFFFADVDFFKIWGQNHQQWILQAPLIKRRAMKFDGQEEPKKRPKVLYRIDGNLTYIRFQIRETLTRFPPLDRSLNGQAKTFGLPQAKIDIETREISSKLGLNSPDEIKSNMHLVERVMQELFAIYNSVDIILTAGIDEATRNFLNVVCQELDIPGFEIKDTTGSNVAQIIKALIFKYFGVDESDKESDEGKNLRRALNLSRLESLQKVKTNFHGYQGFLTVGGLLYSRMANKAYERGKLGDLDLQSCYASTMSSMNVYIGEPRILTFQYRKSSRITLREGLEFLKKHNPPSDGWQIRVSGEFDKVINTLLMSDLRFIEEKLYLPTTDDIPANRKSIVMFNREKLGKKQAESTIMYNSVKFGLITDVMLQAISLLPESWQEEYLNLKVDSIMYFPGNLIVDDLDEYETLYKSLPEEPGTEKIINFEKQGTDQPYRNNVTLRFPISEDWRILKEKRKVFKLAKNPVQEVFKLVGNAGFGSLSCPYLPINNPMAANQITSRARVAAWLVTNSINAFGPITDGSSFNWVTVPLNLKFKEILAKNPEYLVKYDSSIKSGLDSVEVGQHWIDNNLRQHLSNFYEIPVEHTLIQMFNYELKTENFITKKAQDELDEWESGLDFEPTDKEKSEFLQARDKKLLSDWVSSQIEQPSESECKKYLRKIGAYRETLHFNGYINHGAGSYVKILDDCAIEIDSEEVEFMHQTIKLKARSFSSKRDKGILPWYIKSLSEGYTGPYRYEESGIIPFQKALQRAIMMLDEFEQAIALPVGYSEKLVKIPKLISRSQFLFKNEAQLRNFEKNGETLAQISKSLLTPSFWKSLKPELLEPYNVEIVPGYDYYQFSKNHPVGIGFEFLALSATHKGSIESVRKLIYDKIQSGATNFNSALHLGRNIKLLEPFKYFFAAAIILKAKHHEELKELCISTSEEPTAFVVRPKDVWKFQNWRFNDE